MSSVLTKGNTSIGKSGRRVQTKGKTRYPLFFLFLAFAYSFTTTRIEMPAHPTEGAIKKIYQGGREKVCT